MGKGGNSGARNIMYEPSGEFHFLPQHVLKKQEACADDETYARETEMHNLQFSVASVPAS